jgi:hypothetical protein
VNKAEITKLGKYVKQVCECFQMLEEDSTASQAELPTLHRTIERLRRLSTKAEDESVRVMLAKIEYDARKCRDSILERLGMEN